jgi:hypothetical protein
MRRIDYLITEARRIGKNEANTNATLAITDDEVIQYMNDAQDELQGLISSIKNIDVIFNTENIISLVAGQQAYTIPDRVLLNKQIDQVEFSATGNLGDYVVLDKVSTFNQDTNSSNYPVGYYRRGGQIFLTPIPSTSAGTLRVMYERTCDDLDKRRGTVQSVSGLTSTTFTSLTVASDADESSNPNLSTIDYVCIVDKDGVRKAYNIPVGNYDTGTNVLTPAAGFVFALAGDTIVAGDFITFGKWRTTHSQLPDSCEMYLIHYAAEMMLHKDSSNDTAMQSEKLAALRKQILKSIASQTGELQRIPQFNRYEWW